MRTYWTPCCGDVIRLSYDGEFVKCSCGKCFVYSGPSLARFGGYTVERFGETMAVFPRRLYVAEGHFWFGWLQGPLWEAVDL